MLATHYWNAALITSAYMVLCKHVQLAAVSAFTAEYTFNPVWVSLPQSLSVDIYHTDLFLRLQNLELILAELYCQSW